MAAWGVPASQLPFGMGYGQLAVNPSPASLAPAGLSGTGLGDNLGGAPGAVSGGIAAGNGSGFYPGTSIVMNPYFPPPAPAQQAPANGAQPGQPNNGQPGQQPGQPNGQAPQGAMQGGLQGLMNNPQMMQMLMSMMNGQGGAASRGGRAAEEAEEETQTSSRASRRTDTQDSDPDTSNRSRSRRTTASKPASPKSNARGVTAKQRNLVQVARQLAPNGRGKGLCCRGTKAILRKALGLDLGSGDAFEMIPKLQGLAKQGTLKRVKLSEVQLGDILVYDRKGPRPAGSKEVSGKYFGHIEILSGAKDGQWLGSSDATHRAMFYSPERYGDIYAYRVV